MDLLDFVDNEDNITIDIVDDKPKLDIFEVLRQINNKNYNYYDKLSDQEKKLFQPFLVYQWLTSTDNGMQLSILNHIGSMVYELSNFPNLLYKLFCVSSRSQNTRYSWLYKKQPKIEAEFIIAKYLGCSVRVAKMHTEFFSDTQLKEMMDSLGMQLSEVPKNYR